MEAQKRKVMLFFIISVLSMIINLISSNGLVEIFAFLFGYGFTVVMFNDSIMMLKENQQVFEVMSMIISALLMISFVLIASWEIIVQTTL